MNLLAYLSLAILIISASSEITSVCDIPDDVVQNNLIFEPNLVHSEIIEEDGYSNVLKIENGSAFLRNLDFNKRVDAIFFRMKLLTIDYKFNILTISKCNVYC